MKYLVLLVVLCVFVPSFAQRAKVIIDSVFIKIDEIGNDVEVEQLKDGTETPTGYELIGKGHFHVGPVTISCGERVMEGMTIEAARSIGAKTYRFYDVKEPDMVINTCYKSKILFLRKR
jgi:hypothetical protein